MGGARLAHVVDQREAAPAQGLQVDVVARAQIGDQGFDVGFRVEPEGLRQLFFQIGDHLFARKARPRTLHS